MSEIADIEPDNAEVLQDEDYDPHTVPVCISEPVRTVELPSKFAGMRTVSNVTSTTAQKLLGKDPQRKSATILPIGADILLGSSANVALSSGGRWTAAVPLYVTGMDELWAAAVSTTTTVTVIVERWAD